MYSTGIRKRNLPTAAVLRNISVGVGKILRRTRLTFACLLLAAAFCAPQSGLPQTLDPNQTSKAQSAPQPPPASSQPPPVDQTQNKEKDQNAKDQSQPNGTSNDRLFFTLPNFLTLENAGRVPPLTTGQKFKVVTRASFDYVQYPWCAFLAGVSQAGGSEEGFGQGAAGYGKRYGAYFADMTIESYLTGAILPTVFRQDPRYFQSGQGGFWKRTDYSVSRIFVTRTDSGHNQFNYSEILGGAVAAGISTYSYHPRSDRTLENTASVWGSQVGYDTLTLVVREFWPDIRRKLQKKHQAP
jgi:hypothetical protein